MRTVLAFDFDNSIGKAFIGQFDGKKIRYEELKRIKVEPIIDNILLQLIALQAIADVGDGRRIIRKSEKQIMYHPQNSNLYKEKYQQFCDILHIPSPML